MITEREETGGVLAGLAVGSMLAVGSLFSIVAGFVLTVAMVALLVIASPVALVVTAGAALKRRAVRRREAPARARVPAVPPARRPALAPALPTTATPTVVVRLVNLQGTCARGIQYAAGSTFTFGTGRQVTPLMCGAAIRGLLPYVEAVRAGDSGGTARVQCPLSGSVLTFEVRQGEMAA